MNLFKLSFAAAMCIGISGFGAAVAQNQSRDTGMYQRARHDQGTTIQDHHGQDTRGSQANSSDRRSSGDRAYTDRHSRVGNMGGQSDHRSMNDRGYGARGLRHADSGYRGHGYSGRNHVHCRTAWRRHRRVQVCN